jgi:hypothetical protein
MSAIWEAIEQWEDEKNSPCYCKSCKSEGFYDPDNTCKYYDPDVTTNNDYF